MARILFVKTSSLGDVVHHCPAVSDAARARPEAQIDWVVEEPFAGIAAMHPAVRRVIPVAVRRWRRALWDPAVWAEIGEFRRALRGERYDTVIDSQSLVKSALVARLASGTRHGMDRASAREPLAARFYDVTHAVPRGLHAVERNRRLTASALGYALPDRLDYGLQDSANASPEINGAYAVLLTMTSRADKLWPEVRWVELGRALAMPVVLPWGSEEERERAGRIGRGIGQAIVPKRMSLRELGSVFAHARAVVGLDTGLTHVAAALGAPTVGVYCGSDPALTGLYGVARASNVGAPGRPPEVFEVLQSLA
ncbi:MAG TPA: lipopolysaccharide heptosyltransferase I [Burkholderiales bacterium]